MSVPTGASVPWHVPVPSLREAVHRTVGPTAKVTTPVGAPAVEVTVAERLTACPWTDDGGLAVATVDVGAAPPPCWPMISGPFVVLSPTEVQVAAVGHETPACWDVPAGNDAVDQLPPPSVLWSTPPPMEEGEVPM